MYHAPRKVAICQCHCVYRKHQYHIALVVAKSCNTREKVRIIVVWHYTGERKWKDWLVLLPIVGVVATRYFFFCVFFRLLLFSRFCFAEASERRENTRWLYCIRVYLVRLLRVRLLWALAAHLNAVAWRMHVRMVLVRDNGKERFEMQ